MSQRLCNRLRCTRYFAAAVTGLSTLTNEYKYLLPMSNCEVDNHRIEADKLLSTSVSKSILSRNFVAEAADAASPAVVNIVSEVNMIYGKRSATGSGFIYSKDGYIVTNAHVVEHSRGAPILVTMWDSTRRKGVVHSMDLANDIAVIKLVDVGNHEDLPVATMGSSGKLHVGEFVVALGSPMHLSNSITFGIVSSKARHGAEIGLEKNRTAFIQTDAAINEGNSGGPLVNLDGEVVGINTMTVKGCDGISFAIPIDFAIQIIKQLIENKRAVRPYIGMTVGNYNKATGSQLHTRNMSSIFNTEDIIVVVTSVADDSPAYQAGIRKGDTITHIDGKKVVMVADVLSHIGYDLRTFDLRIRKQSGYESSVKITSVIAPIMQRCPHGY